MRAALLLVLVVAGCATPSAPPAPDTAATASFALETCAIQEILASVPPETVAPQMPPGFVAQAFPADGLVAIIALAMRCEAPEPTSLGMIIIPLDAFPEEDRLEGADNHAIVTAFVVDEGEDTLAALTAWGYGPVVERGDVALAEPGPAPAAPLARAGRATVTGERTVFAIDTAVRGDAGAPGTNLIRFFVVHAGDVLGAWDGDLAGDRIHRGSAVVDARGAPPFPDGRTTGLGFHEFADTMRWTRVSTPAT